MRLEYFDIIDAVKVFDVEAGRVEAESTIPMESPVFEGHFPGYPIMPGVLLLEMMNHTSGYLLLGMYNFGRLPFFAGAKTVKIRNFVGPGDVIHSICERIHDGSGFCMTRNRILCDGKLVADAELTMMVMDFPNKEIEGLVQERARAHGVAMGLAS